MKRRNWRHQVLIAGGFLLSGVFLWLALRRVDWSELGSAFGSIHYLPVLGCVAALSLSIVLRGERWRAIAQAPGSAQRSFLRATNLGLLANLLLPARAGEVIRIVALARLSRSSLPRSLASALIDRLVDVFVLIASAAFLLWLLPVGPLLKKWFVIFIILTAVITGFVFLFARSSGGSATLIATLGKRWLRRWALQPEVFLAELRSEFRHLLGSWLSVKVLILAALVLCADYCAILVLLLAFGLTPPFEAPLLLWVFLAAGSALPSAPGYVGIYQVATVWALSFFAVSASLAVAIATVLQIATLVVSLIIGGHTVFGVFRRMLPARNSG